MNPYDEEEEIAYTDKYVERMYDEIEEIVRRDGSIGHVAVDDGKPVSQEELDTAVSDLEQTLKDLGGE